MSELDVQQSFELHPQLAEDCVVLGQFPLSLVLLNKDANYPWCILVPRRRGLRELHHMSRDDRLQLSDESCHLAEVMADLFVPDKINVAALGNMVPQLHVHHIARFRRDLAWPSPVWGMAEAKDYSEEALAERVEQLKNALAGDDFTPAA